MKSVIEFINGYDQKEYLTVMGTSTQNLNDPDVWVFPSRDEAQSYVNDFLKETHGCSTMWNTAEVVGVSLTILKK